MTLKIAHPQPDEPEPGILTNNQAACSSRATVRRIGHLAHFSALGSHAPHATETSQLRPGSRHPIFAVGNGNSRETA